MCGFIICSPDSPEKLRALCRPTTLQEILALGLHGRARLEVTVTGPHAERTLDRVERLLGGVV